MPRTANLPQPDATHDVIIAGAGLAGLTLAVEWSRQPAFRGQRLLLLDRDDKRRNDRTWCFWATDDEPLPPVIYRSWDRCRFFGEDFNATLVLAPYRYHMVRGADFYAWSRQELEKHPGVEWRRAVIEGIDETSGRVATDAGEFSAPIVFNSAITRTPLMPAAPDLWPERPFTVQEHAPARPDDGSIYFLQHFMGWRVRTARPAFDPGTATLMDFRIDQAGETRFVYVLPFSPEEALVEFTVFSPNLLPKGDYVRALEDYLKTFLEAGPYEVLEEEFGVIPMTDQAFPPSAGRVINIGTAGGFVKGSSGYAFKRTQRKLRGFVADWVRRGRPDPDRLRSPWRNRAYDSIMLRVLNDRLVPGKTIFTRLFERRSASEVLRFLDEDATFAGEWRVLTSEPTRPFVRAALRQLPKLFNL
jgi:lycopene beta-cyclase